MPRHRARGLAAPLRDHEQWLGLPLHYLFEAIPVRGGG